LPNRRGQVGLLVYPVAFVSNERANVCLGVGFCIAAN